MTTFRVKSLAAGGGLLVLLALVALAASGGNPISSSADERSLSGGFLDVLFTLGVIGMLLTIALLIFTMRVRREDDADLDLRAMLITALVVVAFFLLIALGAYLLAGDEPRRAKLPFSGTTGAAGVTGATGAQAGPPVMGSRKAHVSWPTVALVGAGLLAVVAATSGRLAWSKRRARRRDRATVEAVRAVLEQALEDLEGGDARTAVIRAYAAMERTLAAAGIPRRPADAPWEFVRRALTELHASAAAAQELTELFERAKFSDHDLGEGERAAAMRALRAVRDELELEVEAA